jgi:hypothetical protein
MRYVILRVEQIDSTMNQEQVEAQRLAYTRLRTKFGKFIVVACFSPSQARQRVEMNDPLSTAYHS